MLEDLLPASYFGAYQKKSFYRSLTCVAPRVHAHEYAVYLFYSLVNQSHSGRSCAILRFEYESYTRYCCPLRGSVG